MNERSKLIQSVLKTMKIGDRKVLESTHRMVGHPELGEETSRMQIRKSSKTAVVIEKYD